jgi:fatty-acyl-CoA synthase
MNSALTPLDFLARSALVYRSRIAVVDGDRRYTYAEFNERVHRAASALRALGVTPGDRVAVLSVNTPAALEAHFAVPMAGAVLVMLNIRLQAQELAWILNHCEAAALIADRDLLRGIDSVRSGLPHLRRVVDDYETLLRRGEFPFSDAREPHED